MSTDLPRHEKAGRVDAALRTERDHLKELSEGAIANAINSYLQNADEDSKARFFDLLMTCDSQADALAKITAGQIVVPVDINWEQVANCWVGAFENGYSPWMGPVSWDRNDDATATMVTSFEITKKIWYGEATFWERNGRVMIECDDPETSDDGNHSKTVMVGRPEIIAGLTLMAAKAPKHFANLVNENDDAGTHDVFAQYVIYGDEIYA